MKCPSCGNENREGAAFCDSCGARLALPAVEDATVRRARRGRRAGLALPAGPLPEGTPQRVAGHLEMVGFIGRGGRKDVFLARDDAQPGRPGRGGPVRHGRAGGDGAGQGAAGDAGNGAPRRASPHLVPVYEDRGAGRAAPFIVSSYMAGGDVKEVAAGSRRRQPRGWVESWRSGSTSAGRSSTPTPGASSTAT